MISIQTSTKQHIYRVLKSSSETAKVIISNTKGHHFIDQNAILYLKSDGNYCHVYLVDGTRILCSKTMKSIYDHLDQEQFIRSHNSIVINRKRIKHINISLSELKLEGGVIVPISRARKKEVKSLIS